MKKRILIAAMALMVSISSMPLSYADAKTVMDTEAEMAKEKQSHYHQYNWYNYWDNYDYDKDNNGYSDYGYNDWNNYDYDEDNYDWYDYDEDDYDWYDYDEDDYNWYDYDEDDYDEDDYDWYNDYEDDYDWYDEDELTVYDISVSPVKKKVCVGKSFYINLIPTDESVWFDLSEEEWEEICEENIESIEFSSTKSKIASVNKFTGKVKAKRKGTTVIKTTVNLINEESITCKTKVTVTK